MNRSVEQALTSLIPRHNGALPPELIELASSLLAQSRTKASNLKAEEEIGRTYACANIACERLKQTLNLPKIEPRPPVPPRVYKQLYSHLSTVLARKRGRPPKPKTDTPTPKKSLPHRSTPSKTNSLTPFKSTPASRKHGLKYGNSSQDIAPWIHPTIRALCRHLGAPAAAPHILAGVTSILTLPSPSGEGGSGVQAKEKLPALIAAVYFFVYTRLSGRETSGKEYVSQRKGIVDVLLNVRKDQGVKEKLKGKNGDKDWEGWEEVGSKDVDAWLMEISNAGWLALDWFENVTEGSGLEVEPGARNRGEDSDDDPATLVLGEGDGNVLQTGLGTMMQDRVDYLSDRKRAEYKVWKEGILARIEAFEAANLNENMDIADD